MGLGSPFNVVFLTSDQTGYGLETREKIDGILTVKKGPSFLEWRDDDLNAGNKTVGERNREELHKLIDRWLDENYEI